MIVKIELVDGTTIRAQLTREALEHIRGCVSRGGPGAVGLRTTSGERRWLRTAELRGVARADDQSRGE